MSENSIANVKKSDKNSLKKYEQGLNLKQMLFSRFFTRIGEDTFQNARLSAIKAGYSEKTASAQGSRLLTKVKIKEYIQQLWKLALDNAGLTPEFVLSAMRHNMEKLREAGDFKGAQQCAQDLAKTQAMFFERHIVEAKVHRPELTEADKAAYDEAARIIKRRLTSIEVSDIRSAPKAGDIIEQNS